MDVEVVFMSTLGTSWSLVELLYRIMKDEFNIQALILLALFFFTINLMTGIDRAWNVFYL